MKKTAQNDASENRFYTVRILTNHRDQIELRFTNLTQATQEFNRIKSQGSYAGVWIQQIDFYD